MTSFPRSTVATWKSYLATGRRNKRKQSLAFTGIEPGMLKKLDSPALVPTQTDPIDQVTRVRKQSKA